MSDKKSYKQTKLSFSQPEPDPADNISLKRKLSEASAVPSKMTSSSGSRLISFDNSEVDKEDEQQDETETPTSNMNEDVIPDNSSKNLKLDDDDDNRTDGNGSEDDADSDGSRDNQFWQSAKGDSIKNTSWGCAINELPQVPECFGESKLPRLKNGDNHVVFFVPLANLQEARQLPNPLLGDFKDKWDGDDEVKMPCSQKSTIPNPQSDFGVMSRWDLITKTLKGNIPGPHELVEAILKYNRHYRNRWKFDGLLAYFFEKFNEQERDSFFTHTLPQMVRLACALPKLFNQGIPFLRKNTERKLTFSQQQVACLLANAFFCTFPRRNLQTRGGSYPDINFSTMFAGPPDEQNMSKIKCILHYFMRITDAPNCMPKGVITYSRHVLRENVDWENLKTQFTKLHMSPSGTIEDTGRDMLQMDFANKYVGGGVLGHGCVQEEIRFLICPEMIISRLFTEVLSDNEVLVMTGCERFSSYTGYSRTFQWEKNFEDDVERDEWGRKYTEVVAMDALHIRKNMNQFEKCHVKRELNKAYLAFKERNHNQPAAVCTGNWGCGAFGGDPELKALIQVMAASHAKRDVCYLSVGNEKLCKNFTKVHEALNNDNVNVGDLFKIIMDYAKKYSGKQRLGMTVLEFVAKNVSVSLN